MDHSTAIQARTRPMTVARSITGISAESARRDESYWTKMAARAEITECCEDRVAGPGKSNVQCDSIAAVMVGGETASITF